MKRIVLAVTGASLAIPAIAFDGGIVPQMDYSYAYQFGAGPEQRYSVIDPLTGGPVEIVDVNLNFNADSVLGCAGMDIGSLIQNTFNVGDLGSEFGNYLKTTLAREALTLVYSSPAVSAVLDGMKALGNARASMIRATCDANEIMANARERRLRSEAYQECLASRNPVECDDPKKLSEHITQLAESKRWSGTLHEFLCNSAEQNCDWLKLMPNFAFDLGMQSSRSAQAAVEPTSMFDRANEAARKRLNERVDTVQSIIDRHGVTEALRLLAEQPTDITPTPVNQLAAGDTETPAEPVGSTGTWQRLLGNACIDPDTGRSLANVVEMINGTKAGDPMGNIDQLIEGTTRCIVDRQIHPHVDLKIAMLPQEKRTGIVQSLSQAAAAQASVNILNAIIFKMSEAIAIHGSTTGTDPNTMNDDMRNYALVKVEGFKNMRDAIRQTLEAHKDLSQRVAALNAEFQ